MVNNNYKTIALMSLLLASCISYRINSAQSQSIAYHIEHQHAKLWINDDGSIDLLYYIKIAVDSGRISSDVFVGMPNEDFTLGEAFQEDGTRLVIAKYFEEGPAVDVKLRNPINAGSSLGFNLTVNVGKMVYLDETNPGNVGLQFIPTWWDGVVKDLIVLVVLPEGATSENVKNQPDYDNLQKDPETGRMMLFWERINLAPNQKFIVGVSFPKELVKQFQVKRTGIEAFIYDFLLPILPIIVLFAVLIIGFILVIRRIRKMDYVKPSLKIESLGVRRGLTAVEAGWLLGLGPVKIVVSILYSLLHKRAIWVTESEPKIKIDVMPDFKHPGGERTSLRYYEIMFLDAIKEDNTLDEKKVADAVIAVRDTVEQKMKGYNRDETIAYYRDIVDKAWKQVSDSGTPELASQAFDENLLWLYMDEKFNDRIKENLSERVLIPDPVWWWYWWWARPGRTPPTMKTPVGEASKPSPLPGAEVADKIVTSIEKSANGIVSNLEKFADSIAPAQTSTKRAPVRRGSGGFCACASCACACACVSCACACAGGRVR